MLSVTLTQMILAVQQRASMENSTFLTTQEHTDNINKGLQEGYREVADAYGDDFLASNTLTGVNGSTALFPLPFAFMRLLGADSTYGGVTTSLRPYTFRERNTYANFNPYTYGPGIGFKAMYRLQGQNINFIPTPPAGTTLTVWYAPAPPVLVNPGDTFDDVYGVVELAVWHATALALGKEESDASMALQMKENARAMIRAGAPQRDATEPARVTDVTGCTDAGDQGFW